MSAHIPLRLVERRWLTPEVLHLVLVQADGLALAFKPGQFVQLFFPDMHGIEQRRSFSLANAPAPEGEPGRWELAVSLLPEGAASRYLRELPLGSIVMGAGPFGRFGLQTNDRAPRYLLLATGTGVAPFRGMLMPLRTRLENGAQVELLCGARTRSELLYADTFLAMAHAFPGFRYRGFVSREALDPQIPWLHSGWVQSGLPALAPSAQDLALVCGNPDMVDACTAHLQQAGLSMRAIRRERYIASG